MDVISLSKKFIAIKSDPKNKNELKKIFNLALSHLKEFTVEQFMRNNYHSALVYTGSYRPKKFRVILNGHLDIIPGKEHQYAPTIRDNRLYGVGSMDMKANVACLIAVFKKVAKKVDYPLGLQIVTDEELGGLDGTQYQIEQGVDTDFVIAGETTNFDIVHQAKGVLWVKITATGKTAHGAYPWNGENAIWKINAFLNNLKKKYPNPNKESWSTTINLCKIQTSNTAFNKIPDNCEAYLDIRYVPADTGKIIPTIKKLLPKDFHLQVLMDEPALYTDKNNQYIKNLQKITSDITHKNTQLHGANGSSDARHFTRIGSAGIEFGPIGGGSGTDNEWVDIASLKSYQSILTKFLLSLK